MSTQGRSSPEVQCARHPDTPTRLLCGRCEAPVCPQCLVHSPVGVRCPQCANVRPLPTFEVTTPYMARAVAAAVVAGAVGGILVALLGPPLLYRLPFLDTIAIVGLGFVIGEIVSLSVNRKRGSTLKLIAAGGTVLAYVIIASLGGPYLNLFHLVAGGIGIYSAVSRF